MAQMSTYAPCGHEIHTHYDDWTAEGRRWGGETHRALEKAHRAICKAKPKPGKGKDAKPKRGGGLW